MTMTEIVSPRRLQEALSTALGDGIHSAMFVVVVLVVSFQTRNFSHLATVNKQKINSSVTIFSAVWWTWVEICFLVHDQTMSLKKLIHMWVMLKLIITRFHIKFLAFFLKLQWLFHQFTFLFTTVAGHTVQFLAWLSSQWCYCGIRSKKFSSWVWGKPRTTSSYLFIAICSTYFFSELLHATPICLCGFIVVIPNRDVIFPYINKNWFRC